MGKQENMTIETQIVKNADDALLTGTGGLHTRLSAFKEKYPMWQDGGYTQELIENLEHFSTALDELLQAMDARIQVCQEMGAEEKRTGIKQKETTKTLTPVINILEKLEKLQTAMGKLVYSPEVVEIVKNNASHIIVYNAARKLIDDFITPLFENDTIFGLVRALVLKRPTLELLYSHLGSAGSKLGPVAGLVAGIDGSIIAACLEGLKKCHLEGITDYTRIETLFKVMLQQLMTSPARDLIDPDIPPAHEALIQEMELRCSVVINSAKEIKNVMIDPAIPVDAHSEKNMADLDEKKINLRGAITAAADKQWDFVHLYTADEQKNITAQIILFKKCIEKIPDATSLNPVWSELRKILSHMPRHIRHYLHKELYQQAIRHDLTPPKWLNPLKDRKKNSDQNSNESPLIIHFAGTDIGATKDTDTLGNLLAKYSNYYIEAGTTNKAWGSDGKRKIDDILTQLKILKAQGKLPTHLVLTGFSRGAAAQIELANKIHEHFNNANVPKENWISIDMFLVDPAYGVFDKSNAATQSKYIPPCVNTLNILYASDQSADTDEIEAKVMAAGTGKVKHYELISDPNTTTIKTLTVNGKHNDLGLTRDRAKETGYFIDELAREFLDNSGCVPKPFSKNDTPSVSIQSPAFNKDYLRQYVICEHQDLSVGYSSSDAQRLINGSVENNKNAEFSMQLGQLATSGSLSTTQEDQYYAAMLSNIERGILYGRYTAIYTRFSVPGIRNNIPRHMFKMYEEIQQYKASLKTMAAQNPKDVFQTIKGIAETANATASPARVQSVRHFYKDIANTAEPDFTQISLRTINIALNKTQNSFLQGLKNDLEQRRAQAIEERNQKTNPTYDARARKWLGNQFTDVVSSVIGVKTAPETATIAFCDKMIRKIDALLIEKNGDINKLEALRNFLKENKNNLTPQLMQELNSFQEMRSAISSARTKRFAEIIISVQVTLEAYKLQNNADPQNLNRLQEFSKFIEQLQMDTMPEEKKLAFLKHYIDHTIKELSQASVPATNMLWGYKNKTQNQLTTALQRAQSQMTIMNSDHLIPIKNEEAQFMEYMQDAAIKAYEAQAAIQTRAAPVTRAN